MECFVRAQMLGRIVLPSTLALPFHIALVFLRVSAALLQGAYSTDFLFVCIDMIDIDQFLGTLNRTDRQHRP